MKYLIYFINQIVNLTLDEQKIVQEYFYATLVPKNSLWIKEGSTCQQIAFVVSGRFRIFYHNEDGTEVTCFFAAPLQFVTSFTSFLTETPTIENIEAIEDAELLTISKIDLEQLSARIPKIHVLRRVIAENLFIMMEKRIAMLQSKLANERYKEMMEGNPDIILRNGFEIK